MSKHLGTAAYKYSCYSDLTFSEHELKLKHIFAHVRRTGRCIHAVFVLADDFRWLWHQNGHFLWANWTCHSRRSSYFPSFVSRFYCFSHLLVVCMCDCTRCRLFVESSPTTCAPPLCCLVPTTHPPVRKQRRSNLFTNDSTNVKNRQSFFTWIHSTASQP